MAEAVQPVPSPLQPPPAEQEHAPSIPSPLNPTNSRPPSKTPALPPAPVQREQREKKDSLKKRESTAANGASSSLGKRKAAAAQSYPSRQRLPMAPPNARDFEETKDDTMATHEPIPFFMPDSERQLYRPMDLAENKRGFRYVRAIADPWFPHQQFFRTTSPPPHCAKFSFEDGDKAMHYTTNALITTNEKGWRMARSNVCAREGTMYYEVKIHRGVAPEGPDPNENGPQPHVRFGWARREAPLDAPVGFDGYSYGVTDIRFETMHRSRPGRFFQPKKLKSKSAKANAAGPTPVILSPEDQHVKEGDVIGVEIQLPSLSLQQKIVTGVYNPAVDANDGFDQSSSTGDAGNDPLDVIRDRIQVPYKGNNYFELADYVATKPMEIYADRTTNLNNLPTSGANQREGIKAPPNPNHEHASLRTLPYSAMRIYKNGKLIGTAFENLLAFLPPASAPTKMTGVREGFDDGMVGYFPAVSCFWGGVAEVNFGDTRPGFWCPPAHLKATKDGSLSHNAAQGPDIDMPDAAAVDASGKKAGWNPGRQLRAIGERYKEQVAEDVVWDIVDEADFFVQDGGYDGQPGADAGIESVVTEKTYRVKIEE